MDGAGADGWDVIVVGAGIAGHCAALEAAAAGARTVLIEKESQIGGSSILSGGFFAFADTDLQRKQGVVDSPELLLDDLAAVGGPDTDPALLKAYSFGQRDLGRWLSNKGVKFTALELSAGQSVPRSHSTNSPELLDVLSREARSHGVTTLCGTAAKRIRRDPATGTVTGVEVEGNQGLDRLRASRGVVLATGGFSRSDELMRIFAPGQGAALRIGGAGSTGDGLRMAWHLGAGFRDMGFVKGTFGGHPDWRNERLEMLLAFYLGAIIVNTLGRRFADESQPYKLLGDACLQQPGALAYQIFDQGVMERSQPGVPLFDFGPPLARGKLHSASTLEELAETCGIDVQALQATVTQYNRDVDAGRDSVFGRDGLCNHAGPMVKIEEPPFYAYPSTSVVLATYCGLTIDAGARVLDVFGEVIDGLYAAGEITGGFHGHAYMTGSALGKAAFFGRVAGAAAAGRARASGMNAEASASQG